MPLRHGNAHRYTGNDQPVCPHCDAEYDIDKNDADNLYDESWGRQEVDCPACGRSFDVVSVARWTFDTDDQPDIDDEPAEQPAGKGEQP